MCGWLESAVLCVFTVKLMIVYMRVNDYCPLCNLDFDFMRLCIVTDWYILVLIYLIKPFLSGENFNHQFWKTVNQSYDQLVKSDMI